LGVGGRWKTVEIAIDLLKCSLTAFAPSEVFSEADKFDLCFDFQVFLQNVKIETNAGLLCADSMGPFKADYIDVEVGTDAVIGASTLGSVLIDTPAVPRTSHFRLQPYSSSIDLEIRNRSQPSGSEIYFHCPHAQQMNLSIQMTSIPVSVCFFHPGDPLADYVLASSDKCGLTSKVSQLQVALSLVTQAKGISPYHA